MENLLISLFNTKQKSHVIESNLLLPEQSNMKDNPAKIIKKVRFQDDESQQHRQKPSVLQSGQSLNLTKTTRSLYDQSKNLNTTKITRSLFEQPGTSSDLSKTLKSESFNDISDSIRVTHLNAEQKKSLFDCKSHDKKNIEHKLPEKHENIQQDLKQALFPKLQKSCIKKSNFHHVRSGNGDVKNQNQLQEIDSQQKKNIGIPPEIDSADVRMTEDRNKFVKESSEIFNEYYDKRGYFIPTDTQLREKSQKNQHANQHTTTLSLLQDNRFEVQQNFNRYCDCGLGIFAFLNPFKSSNQNKQSEPFQQAQHQNKIHSNN